MSKEFKIGIIAVLIIAIFLWGYNFLKGQNLFGSNVRHFKVEYSNIAGLSKASLVTINGLKVGKVEKIKFNQDITKRGQLIVRFSMDDDFQFSKNSVVKIYSPNPLAGSNLAIVPDYNGEMAVSGDLLKGEIESSLFTSIGERLDPLQQKIEKVIVRADTLFSGVNKILNEKTIKGVNSSVTNLAATIYELKQTVKSVNSLVIDNKNNLGITLENTKNITANLSKLSDSLATININNIVKKAENTVSNFNELSKKINSGNGTFGKLMTDKKLYDNLEAATKELEELLREMKLNPKRFVHFSLFGKRAKPYQPKKDSIKSK
ncbi:MAG: MlaD family protein [Polaribacter sp.]